MARLERRGERAQRLIVTDDRITGEPLARLLEKADELGLTLARLPKLTDFHHGDTPIEARPVAIADLLGRPQAALDPRGHARPDRRQAGADHGGGRVDRRELCRQAAGYAPERLILFDNAEHALYQIDMEIATGRPELAREIILGDVRDRARLDQVLARERPELVFHAAAFKHVPMVEANPNEGVLTNIVGTRNVAEACRDGGVGAMVLISTDKAVNPSERHGRDQAGRRTLLPRPGREPRRGRLSLRYRALRQRAGLDRLGGAPVPAPSLPPAARSPSPTPK